MHNFKNIKINALIITIKIIFYIFIFNLSSLKAEECQKFDDKIIEARKYFSLFEEVELNYSLRNSFITNYNKFSKKEDKFTADKIILFMILDENLWYVFASLNNCLVFWIDLEPDRFIELIDGGSISKNQGHWRK